MLDDNDKQKLLQKIQEMKTVQDLNFQLPEQEHLRNWYYIARYRVLIGTMSDEEIDFYKENSFDFGVKFHKWNEWAALLNQFLEEHNTNRIGSTIKIDKQYYLGAWTKRQITNFEHLSDEQKNILLAKIPQKRVTKTEKKKIQRIKNMLRMAYFRCDCMIIIGEPTFSTLLKQCIKYELAEYLVAITNTYDYIDLTDCFFIANLLDLPKDTVHPSIENEEANTEDTEEQCNTYSEEKAIPTCIQFFVKWAMKTTPIENANFQDVYNLINIFDAYGIVLMEKHFFKSEKTSNFVNSYIANIRYFVEQKEKSLQKTEYDYTRERYSFHWSKDDEQQQSIKKHEINDANETRYHLCIDKLNKDISNNEKAFIRNNIIKMPDCWFEDSKYDYVENPIEFYRNYFINLNHDTIYDKTRVPHKKCVHSYLDNDIYHQ